MEKQNFILTSDEETKNKLIELGYTYICKEGKFWRFINNGKLNFEEIKHISYTNKLSI